MFTAESAKRIMNKVLAAVLTAVIVASVIGLCFVVIKSFAVFAGIACLALGIANLVLRNIPVHEKKTVA